MLSRFPFVWAVLLGGLTFDFHLHAVESRLSAAELRVAPFVADITPPFGEPMVGGLSPSTSTIEHPLLAKGVVLRDDSGVYVLAALDLCALVGETYDQIRAELALAAGTTPSRVALHTLHQHTANTLDMASQRLVEGHEGIRTITTEAYLRKVVDKTARAVRQATGKYRRVTHVGTSRVKVDRVASSRRLRQPDGSIISRLSSTRSPRLRDLPEGVIDPWLRTISFYDRDTPVANMHYYATHPQSFYNDGRVTYDVPGIARERLEQETGVPQIYFNGCGGDIAMGNNNGTAKARTELADRLYTAMARSVAEVSLEPASSIGFRTTDVRFSLRQDAAFSETNARQTLQNDNASSGARIKAANILAWTERVQSGKTVDVSCLSLGSVRILSLTGEAFIEYPLWAQQACPDAFLAVAAYGDCGMWYIPTDQAYQDSGGYEQSWAFAAPSETLLKNAIGKVLGVSATMMPTRTGRTSEQ